MTAEEILAKAAELVERPGGWCQGALARDAAVCVRGAISMAAFGVAQGVNVWMVPPACHALAALYREIETDLASDWNDRRGRTAEEVATALRNAKRHLA